MAVEKEDRDAEQGLISGEEEKAQEKAAAASAAPSKSIHPIFYIA